MTTCGALIFIFSDFRLTQCAYPVHELLDLQEKPPVGLQMDSESAERDWASLNSPSISAREMGPGARRNTLNEHCSMWAATAERRRLQENCPKQEEWTNAAAIAAWDAAFESIRSFYDLDASMQRYILFCCGKFLT